MTDSDLLQSNYLGRDGFRWWIGQVADPSTSEWGDAKEVNAKQQVPKDVDDNGKMYLRRCKVRILGYHTISDGQGYVLKDSDLPWAHIMVPAGQGTGVHGVGEFHEYRGGENVMGFFLDGDEAQQPVIIGGFGNQPPTKKNKKKKQSKITDEKDCIINPFQPRINNGGMSQLQLLKSKQTKSQSVTGTKNALTKQPTEETEVNEELQSDPSVRENVGSGSQNSDGGHKANKKGERGINISRESDLASSNFISQVRGALKSIFKTLKSIQSYNDVYLGGAIQSVRSIQRQVNGYLKKISGAVRAWFESFKGFLLGVIEEGINSLMGLLPETGKPILILGVQVGIKEILCVIQEVLGSGIFKTVQDIFENFISGKFIDSSLCAAEDFITEILNKLLSPILDQISGALGMLESILSNVSNFIGDAIGKAMSIIDKIFSFFDCFTFTTPPTQMWSLAGPSKADKEKFNNVVKSLNLPDIDLGDFDPDTDDAPIVCDAYNGYIFPPVLEFSFGDASGSVVVGNGEIVGVYIDEPGRGYSPLFPPAISIIQPGVWGEGGGAKGIAVVDSDTGGISDVIITKPGKNYFSNPILAAQVANAPQILDTDEIPRDKISNVENVIPYLNDLYVLNGGVGYTKNDTILVNDTDIKDLGFDVSIETGPEGSIIEINIKNTNNFPVTFEDRPVVEIISDTGFNANIIPNMNFILVRDFERGDAPDQIVTVTDVNGDQISVKSSEVLEVVQCYN